MCVFCLSSAQFQFTPVGPLYQHMELVTGVDGAFGRHTVADAVETLLKPDLESFLVGSAPDMRKLTAILKAHNGEKSKVVLRTMEEGGAGGGGGGAKPRKRRHNITVRLWPSFPRPVASLFLEWAAAIESTQFLPAACSRKARC